MVGGTAAVRVATEFAEAAAVVKVAGEGIVAGVFAGFANFEAALDFGELRRTGFGSNFGAGNPAWM